MRGAVFRRPLLSCERANNAFTPGGARERWERRASGYNEGVRGGSGRCCGGTRSQTGPVDLGGQGVYTGAVAGPSPSVGGCKHIPEIMEWLIWDVAGPSPSVGGCKHSLPPQKCTAPGRCRTLPICWGLQAGSTSFCSASASACCRTLPICWGLQAGGVVGAAGEHRRLQDPPHLLGVVSVHGSQTQQRS